MMKVNFLERKDFFLKTFLKICAERMTMGNIILKNGPGNHIMASLNIQKEIANCSKEIVKAILQELGDGYFSILVDESRVNNK